MRERLLHLWLPAAIACAALAVFAMSLVSIASTEASLDRDGVTATLAAEQREAYLRFVVFERGCMLPSPGSHTEL